MTTTMFVVRPDGSVEEMCLFDLAALIGPEVITPAGKRCLRWQVQPDSGGNQWLIIDASNGVVVERLASETAARLMAARWNIEEGLQDDTVALGVFDVATDRETAERLAAEARAIDSAYRDE